MHTATAPLRPQMKSLVVFHHKKKEKKVSLPPGESRYDRTKATSLLTFTSSDVSVSISLTRGKKVCQTTNQHRRTTSHIGCHNYTGRLSLVPSKHIINLIAYYSIRLGRKDPCPSCPSDIGAGWLFILCTCGGCLHDGGGKAVTLLRSQKTWLAWSGKPDRGH